MRSEAVERKKTTGSMGSKSWGEMENKSATEFMRLSQKKTQEKIARKKSQRNQTARRKKIREWKKQIKSRYQVQFFHKYLVIYRFY